MNTRVIVLCICTALVFCLKPCLAVQEVFAGGFVSIEDETSETVINQPNETTLGPRQPISLNEQNIPGKVNWPELLIGAFIGWVSGLLSVWVVDHLKEPNLIFEVGSVSEDTTNKWRFIHIKIKNLKRKYRFSPFNTSPAFACKAILKIREKSFIGRWTSKEQPIGNIANVINTALVHPREDIYPYTMEQEAVEVAIGIKYENEKEFYGFNNESYLPAHRGFRNVNYQFGLGVFDGEIIISTLGKTYSKKFKVRNKSDKRKDFLLELVS